MFVKHFSFLSTDTCIFIAIEVKCFTSPTKIFVNKSQQINVNGYLNNDYNNIDANENI